jgi:FtsH-binding integral membrane protein
MQLLVLQNVLTNFRPVFIVMLVILALFFLISFFRQGDKVSFATVLTVSITHLILAGVLFYTESTLVETIEFAADDITLYLFVAIIVLAILNPIVYRLRNNRSQQRYRYRGY